MRLRITLTEEQLQRLDEVVAWLKTQPTTRAIGVMPGREAALRWLVFHYLDSMGAAAGATGATGAAGAAGVTTPPPNLEGVPGDPVPEEVGGPKVEPEIEPEIEPKVEPEIEPELVGPFALPGHWDKWRPMDEPDRDQLPMHKWYTDQEWARYSAPMPTGRVIDVYWKDGLGVEGLPSGAGYPGDDGFGRKIMVQKAPGIGVAHLVPDDWGEPRDNRSLGDVGMWQPG